MTILSNLRKFLSGYFNELLLFLLLIFILRPSGQKLPYVIIWYLCLSGVLITAIFNVHHPKIVKSGAIALGIPALAFTYIALFHPRQEIILLAHFLVLFLMILCTSSILYRVISHARVTMETLRGVICVYFLIGFVFALACVLVELISPGSFYFIQKVPPQVHHSYYLSQMLYFSFITLISIGYGDITPLTNVAQTLAILEGITGQFYLAILVAKLVAIYSYRENQPKKGSGK